MLAEDAFATKTYDSAHVPQSPYGCDVHTHTLESRHAYSTIGECVAAAKAAGLELLGSTDHYSSMLYPDPADVQQFLRYYQYFINFEVWPRVWDGVRVMRGVEADIVDLDGHLFGWDIILSQGITGKDFKRPQSMKDRLWHGIDYAIASIHNGDFTHGATIAQTTNMYVRVLEDPKVLIIGHPGRAGVPFDLDTVLLAAKERGKLIEINEHSFVPHYGRACLNTCRKIAERCAELGVMIAVYTDAHIACDVGRFDAVSALLEEIHFPRELIATRDAATFIDVVNKAIG
jgi:putative hydrolase